MREPSMLRLIDLSRRTVNVCQRRGVLENLMFPGLTLLMAQVCMLNKSIKQCRHFSSHFRLSFTKPFSNHLVVRREIAVAHGQEAVVFAFGMIGLAFAVLCVIASMSRTAREPSI